MSIRKGSIVWYWHKESRTWKRGKVISINMVSGPFHHPYGIWVKNRQTKKPYYIWVGYRVQEASMPRPTRAPFDITDRPWPKGFADKFGYLDKGAYFYG